MGSHRQLKNLFPGLKQETIDKCTRDFLISASLAAGGLAACVGTLVLAHGGLIVYGFSKGMHREVIEPLDEIGRPSVHVSDTAAANGNRREPHQGSSGPFFPVGTSSSHVPGVLSARLGS